MSAAEQIDAARRLLAAPGTGAVPGAPLAPDPGDGLLWTEIHDDGSEAPRRGPVWSAAPPVAGRRSWWVHDLSTGRVVRVTLASRRHQVGRRFSGHWRAAGGRFVDVGTLYTETAPESLTAPLSAAEKPRPDPPARRPARPLPEVIMQTLSGRGAAHWSRR